MILRKIFPDKCGVQWLATENTHIFLRGTPLSKIDRSLEHYAKVRPCAPRATGCFSLCSERGFTLIEVLIVIGIFLLLASLALGIGVDSARRAIVDSERTLMVELLERARNRSMNNIGETMHGVIATPTSFVLFQGVSYAPEDPLNEISQRNGEIVFTGPTNPLIVQFAQLSGEVSAGQAGNIVFTNGEREAVIGINAAGRIDW